MAFERWWDPPLDDRDHPVLSGRSLGLSDAAPHGHPRLARKERPSINLKLQLRPRCRPPMLPYSQSRRCVPVPLQARSGVSRTGAGGCGRSDAFSHCFTGAGDVPTEGGRPPLLPETANFHCVASPFPQSPPGTYMHSQIGIG